MVTSDFVKKTLKAGGLFLFSPNQPFLLASDDTLKGIVLNFLSEFFCVHIIQSRIATVGILFENDFKPPFVTVGKKSKDVLEMVVGRIISELQNPKMAQYELVVSYLKVVWITATRLKIQQRLDEDFQEKNGSDEFYILKDLENYIELHFKSNFSASDFAYLLNVSPDASLKFTKKAFNKTLSRLVSERIIIEAKKELYLTDKAVKEVASELGYDSESRFCCFFESVTLVSPQMYRITVGTW